MEYGVIIFIVLLLIILIIWAVSVQNRLVKTDELCGNAMSQIGVQQATRWDAMTALVDLTKGYSDYEYKALTDIIKARRPIGTQSHASEADAQEGMLGQLLGRIAVLAEAYPELKANTVYLKTMESLRVYEDNVRMSRMVYNDTVTKYNRLIRAFPGSIVAGILSFSVRDYLQEDPAKSTMPTMVR